MNRLRLLSLLVLYPVLFPEAGTALAAPADVAAGGAGRIVALSDIHGAYDAMQKTLLNAGVIDAEERWAGGTTRLVIVGDLLDRGPDSREAMDLLMRLEPEAAAAGGEVHVLLGNHEAMNLMGDLRYVSAGEYTAFAAEETPEERERWFEAYAEKRQSGKDAAATRAEFDKSYPPGYFAHRRAFAANGVYGQWLLSKPVIVVLDRIAFVHGGLSPMVSEYGLDGVNETLVGELADYVRQVGILEKAGLLLPTDSASEHLERLTKAADSAGVRSTEVQDAMQRLPAAAASDLHSPDGPLWYRGNVFCGELIEEDRLEDVLDAIDAERVVIGHTPTPNHQVLRRIDGRVLEVDTGMLHGYYGGSGHALVIEGDSLRVVSEASRESLSPAEHPREVGARPAGLATAEELEQLLLRGELGTSREEGGRQLVTVSDGNARVEAIFEASKSRGNFPAVAAYRLDRLLELDMVPVTVRRDLDGDSGSLQYLPLKTVDEAQRSASGQGAGARCPLADQWAAMYVYDSLIYNVGRNRQRMLYSPGDWQLLLVGHADAFGTRKGRPRHLEQAPVTVNDAWREALAGLDDAVLESELGDVLDARRRRALLARRDELLKP
jgi:hypothetical protein